MQAINLAAGATTRRWQDHAGEALREYIVSEAMTALGIPTTRSLAVTLTGETVMRERPLPGAVLTSLVQHHMQVGTFEFFAERDDMETVQILADHLIDRHYPKAATLTHLYLA